MKYDQNETSVNPVSTNPLAQIHDFHARAHQLRSEAFGSFMRRIVHLFTESFARLKNKILHRRRYQALSALDNRMLRDIGRVRNELGELPLEQELKAGRGASLAVAYFDKPSVTHLHRVA